MFGLLPEMVSLRQILRPITRPVLGRLRRMGYDVVKRTDGSVLHPNIRAYWIERLGIEVVVDVGANEGQFVGWMRDWGYKGNIVSFEPQREAFEACQVRWGPDSRWSGYHSALGEHTGELVMQVAGNSVSSSLLPMLDSHVVALPDSAIINTEMVKIARLDATADPLVREASRLFLKIDTQGFELPVLRGAAGLLERVALIELELSLVPLYDGQALLPDVMTQVQSMGFVPVWLEQGFSDSAAGRMLQMDGLFVRSDLVSSSASGQQ
jgi:FkbM family methyltransferase